MLNHQIMHHIPEHFYRVSVKALVLDEQKRFLLAREDNGFWELLGGGLDYGEKPTIGLAREIHEETGLVVVDIVPRPVYCVTAQTLSQSHWIANLIFLATLKNLSFVSSTECQELRFFTKEEARAEKIFPNVVEFLNIYNPDNH